MKGAFSYTAVFSTGDSKQIKRGSRLYATAYLAIVEFPDGQKRKFMGFSKTRANAEKAISSETAYATGNSRGRYARVYPKKNPGHIIHHEVIDVIPKHAE